MSKKCFQLFRRNMFDGAGTSSDVVTNIDYVRGDPPLFDGVGTSSDVERSIDYGCGGSPRRLMEEFAIAERRDGQLEVAERMVADDVLPLEKMARYFDLLSLDELRRLAAEKHR